MIPKQIHGCLSATHLQLLLFLCHICKFRFDRVMTREGCERNGETFVPLFCVATLHRHAVDNCLCHLYNKLLQVASVNSMHLQPLRLCFNHAQNHGWTLHRQKSELLSSNFLTELDRKYHSDLTDPYKIQFCHQHHQTIECFRYELHPLGDSR